MDTRHCHRCKTTRPAADFIFQDKRHRRICKFCLQVDADSHEDRTCTRCKKAQSLVEFYLSAGKRSPWCRTCIRTARKERPHPHRTFPVSKQCRSCNQTQDITAFYENPGYADGHLNVCKPCHSQKTRKSKAVAFLQVAWGYVSADQAARWMKKYHLTYQDLKQILLTPACAICGRVFCEGLPGNLDHDHETGQMRALLCLSCNLLLGHANEQPEVLTAALIYMKSHASKQAVPKDAPPASPNTVALAMIADVKHGRAQKPPAPARKRVWEG